MSRIQLSCPAAHEMLNGTKKKAEKLKGQTDQWSQLLVGICNELIWRSSMKQLLQQYNARVSVT
jgi:hypothetical protein